MKKVFTLYELKQRIAEIEQTIGDSTEPVFLTTKDGNGIGVHLIRNILTDGSQTFDLEVAA